MSQAKQIDPVHLSRILEQLLRHLLSWVQAFFAAAPLLFISLTYLFSAYAALHLGHWPQPLIDDPKFIASDDLLMDLLYFNVPIFLIVAFCSVVVFPLLTLLHWRSHSRKWHFSLIAIFLVGCLLSYFGVSDRLDWYFD
jgi:hypothetical protein